MPQIQLPIFPEGVAHITPVLVFGKQDGRVTYFNGSMPVFVHDEEDRASFQMITAQLCVNGNAKQADILRAFGVTGKSERSATDRTAPMGAGAADVAGRLAASVGELDAVSTHFTPALGVPDGGLLCVLPALLAVGLLDGVERRLQLPKCSYGFPQGRSAQDAMAACFQALLEEEVKPLLVQFLMERGLELAEEKTRIVHIDHAIWRMTWNWAKRRHPQRVRKWVKDRYYARREGCDWVFTDGSVELFRMLSIPIRRHVLIRGASNPYAIERLSLSSKVAGLDRVQTTTKLERVCRWFPGGFTLPRIRHWQYRHGIGS